MPLRGTSPAPSPTPELTTPHHRLFEADANLLAIRRLLSRSLASSHSNTTPGPPLSSSHPSPSLVAKLHLHVYTLYDEARSLIKTASRLSDSTSGDEVIPDLRRYLSDGRGIALSLSYKWLGVDAGENGGREKGGDAIAWLKMAKSGLEEVRGKGKLGGMTMGNLKSRVGGKERQGKVGQELESVAAFLSAYSKVNDTVRSSSITLVLAPTEADMCGYAGPLCYDSICCHAPAFRPSRARSRLDEILDPSSSRVHPRHRLAIALPPSVASYARPRSCRADTTRRGCRRQLRR